jgi:hypothetical protein
MKKYTLKAVRVTDFDMVGDKHYGDAPYGVVLDVYDNLGEFLESGTDWSYFSTELEAQEYIKEFNQMRDIIKYYQENKNEFWKDCLLSSEDDKEYLYDEWIEDYFMTTKIK